MKMRIKEGGKSREYLAITRNANDMVQLLISMYLMMVILISQHTPFSLLIQTRKTILFLVCDDKDLHISKEIEQ